MKVPGRNVIEPFHLSYTLFRPEGIVFQVDIDS